MKDNIIGKIKKNFLFNPENNKFLFWNINQRQFILALALGFGLFVSAIDAILDYFIFYEGQM